MESSKLYTINPMTTPVAMTCLLGDAVGGVPWKDSELVAALLILVLGIALGIGVTCLLMVVHFLRKGRFVEQPPVRRRDPLARDRRLQASLFQVPTRWLAV